jgi:DNA primase
MMAPGRLQTPDERRAREEDRQRKIAALHDRALGQIQELRTGEDWTDWLRLAARFPGQSFANIMLIAVQRPDATLVAGYQEWQAQGRHVTKSEPGIQIIADSQPSRAKGDTAPSAGRASTARAARNRIREPRFTYVWDITQTSGPALPTSAAPSPASGQVPTGLWDALTWLARREGFAAEREYCGSTDSLTSWSSRRIRVRPGLSNAAAAWALAHELGHVLMHDTTAHPPRATTAECRGVQKVEADSVAFIVVDRLGLDTSGHSWPYVASWAGGDPRARPEAAIQAAGERIAVAAGTVAAHLDLALFATPSAQAAVVPVQQVTPAAHTEAEGNRAATSSRRAEIATATTTGVSRADISSILAEAEAFYLSNVKLSWVSGYLATRGHSEEVMTQWRIGYAPAGWTTLIDHLRGLGRNVAAIQAAGLARRSSRGTLIDHFRDRLMLAIRAEDGTIAGFIGRARPDAGPTVPKYLNSPETVAFTKGDLLFGLHEARGQLAGGAVPVIVEGPFDAIAVSAADSAGYAGLAPSGTALTIRQAAALGRFADLRQTGVLVALDGDRAGRDAMIKAHGVLLTVTRNATAVILPTGRDPAEILQTDGPAALSGALQQAEPLARVVIDAHIDRWAPQLDHVEGQVYAMRSAASFIASLLPAETAEQILQITGGRHLQTLDEYLHFVTNTELPEIARILPPNAICQIVRVTERLDTDHSEVTAELANAVTREAAAPKRSAACGHQNDLGRGRFCPPKTTAARLATASFPDAQPTVAGTTTTPERRSAPTCHADQSCLPTRH